MLQEQVARTSPVDLILEKVGNYYIRCRRWSAEAIELTIVLAAVIIFITLYPGLGGMPIA